MEIDYQRSEWLLRMQKAGAYLLRKFHLVCQKHNLQYFLAYGTLLGAIRHQGFIPWDDDIDIAMPREDYERLGRLTQDELGDEIMIQNQNNDSEYWLPFYKVRLLGTEVLDQRIGFEYQKRVKEKGIWLDIFPMDRCGGSVGITAFEQRKFNILRLLQDAVKYDAMQGSKLTELYFSKRGIIKMKVLLSINSLFGLCKTNNKKRLLNLYHSIAKLKSSGDFLVTRGGVGTLSKLVVPADCFFPAKDAVFEGASFKVPNNPDFILRKLYGDDYMMPPPVELRYSHQTEDTIVNVPDNFLID